MAATSMVSSSASAGTAAVKNGSPQSLFPLPAPSPRRQRCLSCSDNYLDLGVEEPNEMIKDPISSLLPDVIVTRRTRSDSICGRIVDEEHRGTVKYFCRSRGHGFITSDEGPYKEIFVHISDIEGEFVPRKGDRVSYRLCPIPPRFDKFQAVHVHIVDFTKEAHRRWEMPETPEELEEDRNIKSLPYDV